MNNGVNGGFGSMTVVDRFEVCLAQTIWYETGIKQTPGAPFVRGDSSYSNDPDDSGGPTCMGVVQRVYDAWRDARGERRQGVEYISDDEVRAIYRKNYWDLVRGDELPIGVDGAVFDFGVNSGCGRSTKFVQRLCGTKPDGALGALTLTAIHRQDPQDLVRHLQDERRTFVQGRANYWKFGKGWELRIDRVERMAMSDLGFSPNTLAEYLPLVDEPGQPLTFGGRATTDAPESMAQSTTGNVAIGIGAGAFLQIFIEVAGAVSQVTANGGHFDILAILLVLANSNTFRMAVGTTVGSVYIWLERRLKLIREAV